jgi:hypothetical protein
MSKQLLLAALLVNLVLMGRISAKDAYELPTEPFSYHEDFEGKDPMQFWVSNGEHEIHFKGITDEKAFSGTKSFKLDVTLKKGSYHYWSAPVKVPCQGKLKFSGRIWVEEPTSGRVGLGANFAFPPTHHSGCGAFDSFGGPTEGWRLQQSDLVPLGAADADSVIRRHTSGPTGQNVVVYLDRWGLFISGGQGKRVVVYVDDIKIEGEVPKAADYETEAQRRWQPAQQAFQKRLEAWRSELLSALDEIKTLGQLPPIAQRMKAVVLKAADTAKGQLADFEKRRYVTPWEVDELEANLKLAGCAAPNIREMSKAGAAERPYVTYVRKAITNDKMLPKTFPIVGGVANELSIAACRGEYEPATFAICALADIQKLTVLATDMKGPNGTIPASAVDIRVVKCWFQSGVQIWDTNGRILTPELLLKDDSLVRVDLENKHNYVRTLGPDGKETYVLVSGPDSEGMREIQPRDASTLQAVDIEAETTKQFWVTVRVPDDAAPGCYEGRIRLTAAGVPPGELILRVRVLPFTLEKPLLRYSIYYRGKLTSDGRGSISSENKSPEQYEAEMRDLKAHGVEYPTVYQGYDEELLDRVLKIRKKAGMTGGPLYSLGISTGNPTTPAALEALRSGVRKWLAMAGQYGYDELYVYGIDEATGERLKSQRAAWQAVHQAGGKVFVACYKGTFELMGDLLDVAVYAGPPVAEEADKYHQAGHQIFSYANPQVGVEQPETYRRNFGLLLWKTGYDGAMDYAYQHSFGHSWNDFDHQRYRDHNFTYQTADGVIDTIQWEGFREGVDDVRYLTTLLKAIKVAKANPTKAAAAEDAERWLKQLDITGDLHEVRCEIARRIIALCLGDPETKK